MPTKGYRKGTSDNNVPHPRQVYFRVSVEAYQALVTEAAERNITLSEQLRILTEAHISRQRAELPHRHTEAPLLRELARIGNNVNQVAYQANLMNLPLIVRQAEACLASLDALLCRMRA